jgi:hypothetical protein
MAVVHAEGGGDEDGVTEFEIGGAAGAWTQFHVNPEPISGTGCTPVYTSEQ